MKVSYLYEAKDQNVMSQFNEVQGVPVGAFGEFITSYIDKKMFFSTDTAKDKRDLLKYLSGRYGIKSNYSCGIRDDKNTLIGCLVVNYHHGVNDLKLPELKLIEKTATRLGVLLSND